MISIEWDIFSGQENDRWDLTVQETTDFIATLVADLTVVRPLLSIPAVLGPKGYIVHLTGLHATLLGLLGVPTSFRITDLPLDLTYLDLPIGLTAPGDSELGADAGVEEPEDADFTGDGGGGQSLSITQALATCSLNYTSWNDFTFWNGTRRETNNCYCYAANYATNNWSLPGRKGGAQIPSGSAYKNYSYRPTATRFTNALTADGWKTTCNGSSLRIVALVGKVSYDPYQGQTFAAEWDYHFYRKNLNSSTARWCHKGGKGAATNKDASGNYITAVSTADRSKYYPPTAQFPIGVTINYDTIIGTFYSPAGTRSWAIS